MVINIQDDILKLHAAGLLDRLLADKTTGRNILWASDAYGELGPLYARDESITAELITGEHSDIIKTRARKAMEQQSERTRRRGEVFTPLWVCEKMIDYADEVWFGRAAGFRKTDTEGHVCFTQKRPWQKYVQTTRLEITCGEAPFLVQRYDVETGEAIPVEERSGILDRKLRAVSENTADEADWLTWALKAVQATYGYEFQGDNLLIARVNVWMSVEEHFQRWRKGQGKRARKLTKPEGRQLCDVIAWNLWQMDGLTGAIPFRKPEETEQFDILYLMDGLSDPEDRSQPLCRINDWGTDRSIEYASMKKESRDMKFNFIIGNPPYQEETESDSTRMPPIYNHFMDQVYEIAEKVELITPARFLFNAGQTPKAWNQKMLNDPHLKVLHYEQDASKIFSNTDIKGGVAITYRDSDKQHGPIRAFVPHTELRTILEKAGAKDVVDSLTDIADSSNVYNLKNIYADHPDYRKYIGDGGRHSQLKTNVLNINPIFTDAPTEADDYSICGLVDGKRGKKYCHRRYLKSEHKSLFKYKVLVPKATGSGKFGDVLPEMIVVQPGVAFTQTYISIGTLDSEIETTNLLKYLKTKLCRALLYVLKVTQDNLPAVWRYIPKQDFTPTSDIDWSRSIPDIDRQLYAKYGLDEAEIEFIETHVKAME